MAAKSAPDRYGAVAILFHWLTVLVIFALILSGLRADGTEDTLAKAAILRVHVPLGILVLLLTLGRIAWWLFADKKPAPVPMPKWQDRASRAVHGLFYVLILGMTASGIGMLLISGAGPIIFGVAANTLPDFWDYPPRAPHGIGAWVLIVLLVLHAGAALHHQFVKRDGMLRRMWFGAR